MPAPELHLPPELMLRVVQYCAWSDPAVCARGYATMSRVNRAWRRMCWVVGWEQVEVNEVCRLAGIRTLMSCSAWKLIKNVQLCWYGLVRDPARDITAWKGAVNVQRLSLYGPPNSFLNTLVRVNAAGQLHTLSVDLIRNTSLYSLIKLVRGARGLQRIAFCARGTPKPHATHIRSLVEAVCALPHLRALSFQGFSIPWDAFQVPAWSPLVDVRVWDTRARVHLERLLPTLQRVRWLEMDAPRHPADTVPLLQLPWPPKLMFLRVKGVATAAGVARLYPPEVTRENFWVKWRTDQVHHMSATRLPRVLLGRCPDLMFVEMGGGLIMSRVDSSVQSVIG